MPELGDIAKALRTFGGHPQKASSLASMLGFEPVQSPVDLLSGQITPLARFLDARFGVGQLYRVGGIDADAGTAGLYIATLNDWGGRSSERDRPRRRLARALVEYQKDARAILMMVPNQLITAHEAEFVLPRSSSDLRKESTARNVVSTVRALVDLQDPSRFHRELLRDLVVRPGTPLLEISQQWQRAFSVERATKKFYQEYTKVRDRVAEALKDANPEHPVVSAMSYDEARAWATRQLGRMLFLWFLQSKQWLGYDWQPRESSKYLVTLWSKRQETCEYYGSILLPLFFKALAERNPGHEVRDILGYTPYLNGGLFRRNPLEDRMEESGRVRLPDELFDPKDEMSVLGLLSRYRFTTRESTPDDQSVDPDPELLGRVFENLYQGDERHDTGTFYTPREIVQFMCRQVLDGYLCDIAGVSQESLDWVRKQVTEPDEDRQLLSLDTEEALVHALEGVRVCDPAVGSGAFLLGMMQEIVQLRRGILHTKKHYIEPDEEDTTVAVWKRRAITWSLYGVDINPEAVEICQLRLWLSLVLDSIDPTKIDPLPNLDFRIVAGDSLVDRVADITFSESLPPGSYQPPLELGQRVGHEEQQIDRWRREFEATQDNPARLKELRDNVTRAQMRIVRYHLDAEISKVRDEVQMRSGAGDKKKATRAQGRLEHLQTMKEGLNPDAPYQKPFLWPVAFPEVLNRGGFDIVLANPPYIRQEKLAPEDQESYKQAFGDVFSGTADILTFFYARSVQILKNRGWLAFITSNKYMRAAYGQGLREYLVKRLELRSIVDFGDLPVFDASGKTVASYPAVLIGRKNGKAEENEVRIADLTYPVCSLLLKAEKKVNPENVRWTLEDLRGLLSENEIPNFPQVLLRREGWVLGNPTLVRLFHRLMEQGTPFNEFVKERIYYGIKTGCNEAYVIDEEERNELVRQDDRSAELIRPWIRGQDIKKRQINWGHLYLIRIQSSTDPGATHAWKNAASEEEAQRIFKSEYPGLHEHLSCWESRLRQRQDQGRFWWELRPCVYYGQFEQSKIVWPDITSGMRFAWDSRMYYVANTGYAGIGPDWLVPLLNSSILEFVARVISTAIRGGYLRLIYGNVASLPIVEPPTELQTRLSAFSQTMSTDEEGEADEIVARLYNLSENEARLMRTWKREIEHDIAEEAFGESVSNA